MKVLFDANVWISAMIRREGNCRRLIDETVLKSFDIATCDAVVTDVAEKLADKFEWDEFDVRESTEEIASIASFCFDPPEIPKVCRDPDDDVLLAVAAESDCTHLVTGDGDLLVLGSHGNVAIITVAQFAELLAATVV